MMTSDEFRKHGHELVDWMADYFEQIEDYPVKSQVALGDILAKLPTTPPQTGEPFPKIMADFKNTIIPGMTHWQHPGFFAYFNANNLKIKAAKYLEQLQALPLEESSQDVDLEIVPYERLLEFVFEQLQ